MGLGDTEATLRNLGGAICPRCRHRSEDPIGPRLQRCPTHPDVVLVPPHAVASSDGDPFLGAVVAGRFAVVELIGAGSMGTVYRARQEAMGRDVALKVVRADRLLDAQAKTRFQHEAHAMSLLASTHTVTVYDFGEVSGQTGVLRELDGSLYLAMELLDGESIGDRIKRLGRLDLGEVMLVVRHTLSSLAEAHDKGIIHRDLKPDNLLLTRGQDGKPLCKVLDFGIAKILTSDGRVDALETQAGTVFGTPRYMSPEQAQGKKLDARSDLYALGVILYHMLVGKPPFGDDDAVVVMAHHIKTVPRRPSEAAPDARIPAALEELLMRVLAKDPARRPQSAREFQEELDRLASSSPDGSVEVAAVTTSSPPSARRVALGIGALAGALALAAGGVVVARRAPETKSAGPTSSAFSGRSDSNRASAATPQSKSGLSRTAAASASAAETEPIASGAPDATGAPEPSAVATDDAAASGSASASKPSAPAPRKRGYTKFDR